MCTIMQYSGLASEVKGGRGKVPVADYQVAEYVNRKDIDIPSNLEPISRSCYSFCMCPGGQVLILFYKRVHQLLILFIFYSLFFHTFCLFFP